MKFFTAAGLVTTYLEAREQRQVLRLQAHVALCPLLLGMNWATFPRINWGPSTCLAYSAECYERTSHIVTTNLPFAEWPHVFAGDECLASALIERLTHRVHVIDIQGESYRLHASLKARKGCGIAKMATT